MEHRMKYSQAAVLSAALVFALGGCSALSDVPGVGAVSSSTRKAASKTTNATMKVASTTTKATKKAAQFANPLNWFGDDEAEQQAAAETAAAAAKVSEPKPDSASIGTVHMVDHTHDFLLIRSSRNTSIEYGTPLISQRPSGRQSAELKLSPERKGAFLVADIVKGSPDVGDIVKLVGATDGQSGGVVPIANDEVQVLE